MMKATTQETSKQHRINKLDDKRWSVYASCRTEDQRAVAKRYGELCKKEIQRLRVKS